MDCPDGTDEADCDHVCIFVSNVTGKKDCFSTCLSPSCTCSDLYYHCSLGGCVPWSRVCDGVMDCPNNEDEQACHFYYPDSSTPVHIIQNGDKLHFPEDAVSSSEEFYCQPNVAIPQKLKNDLVPDCLNQIDEDDFHNFLSDGSRATYSTETLLCPGSEETTCVKNFPDVCYPRHLHCMYESHISGTVGCSNGGHLSGCWLYICPSQFKCPNAYCVPVHTVCDGKPDCPNGEEETHCHSISCPGLLLCRNDDICVHPYDVWKDHVKCDKSKDDKALTNVPRRPTHCLCLGYAISCKSTNVDVLPQLPVFLRVLWLDKVHTKITGIKFGEGNIFLLGLRVTNASLDQLEPSHLSSFPFLKTLNLSHNTLTRLTPGTFSAQRNLEKMDLSHNLLDLLHPDIFTGAYVLAELNLNHNSIRVISRCTFQSLRQLKTLTLSHNKLTRLGQGILCGLSLKELDVSYNSLSVVDKSVLVYSFQHLKILNTMPTQICCDIPKELKCVPVVRLTKLSSCSNIIESSGVRGLLWFAGFVLLSLLSPSVAWSIRQIRVRASSKNLYNILSLLLFASNMYVCMHFFIMLSVDHLYAGYYSLYEETWRRHTVCSLLNISSYAFFQTTQFLCSMISCTRTIAAKYPFKAQDISTLGVLSAVVVWFAVSMFLSYSGLAWLFSDHKKSPERALGLGLLLPNPGAASGPVPWHGLIFIIPNASVLLFICFSQGMMLHGLKGKSETTAVGAVSAISQVHRKKAIRTSFVAFLLAVLQYSPFLITHLLAVFKISINLNAGLIVIMWTLFVIPAGNVILHVFLSNDFRRWVSKILTGNR